jgi:hypothetical protein
LKRLLQGTKMCLVGFEDGTSQCSCTKLVSAVAIVHTYQSIGASREPSTFPRPPWDSTKRLKTCAPHICNVDYVPKCQSRSRRSLRNSLGPKRPARALLVDGPIGDAVLGKWAWWTRNRASLWSAPFQREMNQPRIYHSRGN